MPVSTSNTLNGQTPSQPSHPPENDTNNDRLDDESDDGDDDDGSSDDDYAFDSSDEIVDAPMPLPPHHSIVGNTLPYFYRASPSVTVLTHEFQATESGIDIAAILRDWPHEIRCVSLPWGLSSWGIFQAGFAIGMYRRTIRMIYLRRCDLDAASLGRLLTSIPQLIHLRLQDCRHVTPETLHWPLRWHQSTLRTVTLEGQAIEQDPEALAVLGALVDGLSVHQTNRLFWTVHIYHLDWWPWP